MLETSDSLTNWLVSVIDANRFLTLESFHREITRLFIYAFDTKKETFLKEITQTLIKSTKNIRYIISPNQLLAEKEISSLNILAELGKHILYSIQTEVRPVSNLEKYLSEFHNEVLSQEVQRPHTITDIIHAILILHKEGRTESLILMFDNFALLQNKLLKEIRQHRVSSGNSEEINEELHKTVDSLHVLNSFILSSRISPRDSSPPPPKSTLDKLIAHLL